MRAIGIYLVGVGELITPSPKEVLRQAKTVGQAISAKVYPETASTIMTGSFAAVLPANRPYRDLPDPAVRRVGFTGLCGAFVFVAARTKAPPGEDTDGHEEPHGHRREDHQAPWERLRSVLDRQRVRGDARLGCGHRRERQRPTSNP